MGTSVEESIKKWLETQGYPLEMRVARQFIRSEFTVSQGTSYSDPVTNAPRELDVRALVGCLLQLPNKRVITIAIELATECKSTRGKPWIAFSDFDNFFSSLPPSWDFQMSPTALWLSAALPDNGVPFPMPSILQDFPRAYSATIGFREANTHDLAHQSLLAATAAAHASNHPPEEDTVASMRVGHLFCQASIPLVVVDNGLFLASLTSDGHLEVRDAPGVIVQTIGPSGPKRAVVIQERTLPALLASMDAAIVSCRNSFEAIPASGQERIWEYVEGMAMTDAKSKQPA